MLQKTCYYFIFILSLLLLVRFEEKGKGREFDTTSVASSKTSKSKVPQLVMSPDDEDD